MTRSAQFWTHALQQQLLFSVGMRSNSGTRPRSFERDEQAQQNWHRLVERFHGTAHNNQNVFMRPPHPTLSPQAGRGSGTPCEHHLVFGDAVVLSLSPFFTGRGWGEGRAHMISKHGNACLVPILLLVAALSYLTTATA